MTEKNYGEVSRVLSEEELARRQVEIPEGVTILTNEEVHREVAARAARLALAGLEPVPEDEL